MKAPMDTQNGAANPQSMLSFQKIHSLACPQELITAILVRLPLKYILRCKCVSTYWLTLISTPEFVNTHLSFSSMDYTRHRLMLREETHSPFDSNLKHCSVSSLFNEFVTEAFDLDYPKNRFKQRDVCIVGSANGLFCLLIGFDFLVLWNPSTRKFKQVPDICPKGLSGTVYGFGYDKVHDDYKIVGVPSRDGNADAKIYSLKSDSWRKLDDYQEGALFPWARSGKFVNGKLHWLTKGRDIMSIDLVDEKCGNVEQPCFGEGKLGVELEVLGSDFSVLCNYYERDNYQITHADVWVMKDYGVKESWTKLYTIKYSNDSMSSLSLCVSHKGEILILCNSTVAIYNSTDRSFRYPESWTKLYTIKYSNDSMSSLSLCVSHKGEILILCNSTVAIYNSTDRSFRYPEVTDVDGSIREAEVYFESLISPILQNE